MLFEQTVPVSKSIEICVLIHEARVGLAEEHARMRSVASGCVSPITEGYEKARNILSGLRKDDFRRWVLTMPDGKYDVEVRY